MVAEPIRIEGLSQFVRNLKKMNKDLPKAVRLAHNEAAEIVVNWAKPNVPTGPSGGGHAASSVKARSTRTEGRVTGGGAKYPYYPWLDFGGRVGPKRSVIREFINEGRYIYPGFTENVEDVNSALLSALLQVAVQAGVEVDT